jgi:sulfur relay (sulfurtransferase) complex TusBCD TusD component (DsrE family)
MTELSPQAQAVLGAAFSAYWSAEQEAPNDEGMIAAAALRAAADQVVPLHICGTNATRAQTRLGIRHKLLAIAAELEGGND